MRKLPNASQSLDDLIQARDAKTARAERRSARGEPIAADLVAIAADEARIKEFERTLDRQPLGLWGKLQAWARSPLRGRSALKR
jgi:hypothetical protein